MLKEGIFLGKRYEILSRVGSGGMADVYKGKDHKLNRYVAIKVLKSDFRTDEIFIQKFLSEAQAAAGLMHPNVVNVYDVGQDRGLYYMVMELVEGITLKEYVEKKGRLGAKETISISIQMVTGIQAAHSQHIIHRDIKPQNIIISKEGKVKVTDFGIARATTSANTISTNVMGSVHYTSPEHARGGIVDEKSDIYSAGITMYEMITGHVPYDGDSTVTVAIKHLQEEAVSPSEEVPDIPYSLECIILKCMQKNPQLRYPDCQSLILDLKRSLVSPESDFVDLGGYVADSDETVMMTTGDMERIQSSAYDDDYGHDDDSDDSGYDDDYDDRDDYGYDNDRYGGKRNSRRGNKRKSGDVDPNTKKITKILMVAAAVIIAAILIILVGKGAGLFKTIGFEQNSSNTKVSVPSVVGMTEEQAKKELSKKGLGYYVTGQEASDKYDKGLVIRQETSSGTKVDKNTQINVVVSLGKKEKMTTVPDVTGQDEGSAQRQLEKSKLVVDSQGKYDDTVETGKVISTDPPVGTEVKEGSKITMFISLGAEKVTVPSILGLTQEEADSALSAVGLTTGSVTEDYSSEYPAGVVMKQTPRSDTKAEKYTAIDYVISKGSKEEMATVPPLSNLTESAAKQKLAEAGLTVGSVTYAASNVVSKGYVISQSASPGEQLKKGISVDFVVSQGAAQTDSPGNSGTNGGGSTEGQ